MIVRRYELVASSGRAMPLERALSMLADQVRAQPGCIDVAIHSRSGVPGRFAFVEQWMSAPSQQTASAALGKDAFAAVMAELAEPPVVSDWERRA